MTESVNRQTGLAEVNGTHLYYEMAGVGQPFVLLHAGIADERMWNDQFDAFAQRYRTIRYDMRGYGNSALGDGTASRDQDLHGLLDVLGIEKVNLLGCSQGGTTVIDFALEHPERVSALVLVSATPSGITFAGEMPPTLQAFFAAYRQQDLAQAAELATQLWFDGPQRKPEQMRPAVRQRVRAMIEDVISTGALDMTGRRAAQRPAIDRLATIQAPTLVVVGNQDDPIVLQAGDLLVSTIPGAVKAVITDAAHLSNLEKPEEFTRVVLDFLRQ